MRNHFCIEFGGGVTRNCLINLALCLRSLNSSSLVSLAESLGFINLGANNHHR